MASNDFHLLATSSLFFARAAFFRRHRIDGICYAYGDQDAKGMVFVDGKPQLPAFPVGHMPDAREVFDQKVREQADITGALQGAGDISDKEREHFATCIDVVEALIDSGWSEQEIEDFSDCREVTSEMADSLVDGWCKLNELDCKLSFKPCPGEFWYSNNVLGELSWVVIDNSDGNCWMEAFETEDAAKAYLLYGLSYEDACAVDSGAASLEDTVKEALGIEEMPEIYEAQWVSGKLTRDEPARSPEPHKSIEINGLDTTAFPWVIADWHLGEEAGSTGIDLSDGDMAGFERPASLDGHCLLDEWTLSYRDSVLEKANGCFGNVTPELAEEVFNRMEHSIGIVSEESVARKSLDRVTEASQMLAQGKADRQKLCELEL